MLVSIGRRAQPNSLVDLLLECHERIRTFLRLAVEVGVLTELTDAEVLDGVSRVKRYFIEALPLHVADEEESLLPRLRGQRSEVDEALASMHAEHTEHEALLAELLATAGAVGAAPRDDVARARLLGAATALTVALEAHLMREEQVVFPAARTLLPAATLAAITTELRGRRAAPLRAPLAPPG